jgi:galactokinase
MTAPSLEGTKPPLEELLVAHRAECGRRFGDGEAPRLFFSPGRVNLMGAHLDYNGGPVMPTAIDRGTFLAVRTRADRTVRLASTLDDRALEFELGRAPETRRGCWTDYPLGVLRELMELAELRGGTARLSGLEILFGGNLPVGAGLSSSASICVGSAVALDRVWGLACERMELVQAALRAERGFVGVQCGIMDPFAVGLARPGQLLWLDCRDTTWSWIPLDPARWSIAIADTLVRRELAQGAFNQRVEQCRAAFAALRPHQPDARCLRDVRLSVFEHHRHALDPVLARRAEHVIREVARTFAARDALLADDPRGLGVEMTRAHASLRDLFDVSVPELDLLVETAVACPGVLGSRLTGAGFGGCTVILVRRGAEPELAERLGDAFERRFGRAPRVEVFAGDPGPREIVL